MQARPKTLGRSLTAWLAVLGLLYAPVLGAPAGAQLVEGDDLFLLTTSTAPNVILLMDNSQSMNHIEWHPAFDPNAGSYGCTNFDNNRVYTHDEVRYRTAFNGSSDYVEVAHDASYLLDDGSVSLWFTTPDTSQGDVAMFSKDSSGYDTGGHLTIRLLNSGRVQVRFQSTSADYWVTSSGAVSADTWHHIAFTWGSGGMKLYLDGALEDTDPYTGGTGTTSGGTGNFEPIVIGANSWTSGNLLATPVTNHFLGEIDETAIFDSALSLTEVQDISSYGLPNGTIDAYKLLNDSFCGNERQIWAPSDPTLWDGRYLNWYFSDDADPYYSEIQTAKANVEGCTQAGSSKFFDDKYRRTRFEASKQVLLDLLCVAESKNVRFGLATFRDAADLNTEDPNGGFIAADLGRSNPSHAAELETKIKNNTLASETPLSESLFQIYSFWMSRDTADIPVGADGLTKFPVYEYDKFGALETNSSQYLEDPMAFQCEKAFVVILTDGLPTRDDFDQDPASTSGGYDDFGALIGDYHDEGADAVPDPELPGDTDESSFYLDDIAKYMQDNDFRPDLGGDQLVDTYAVGLATDQTTDDFLQMTADVGNGLFFHTQDGDQLTFALIAALNDIIEKSSSFTAAAVPSARTADGADFYQAFFLPSGKSAFWEGHVRAWQLAQNGDILDKNGNCALDDPDAGECNSGPFKTDAEFLWDALDQVPPPGSRSLYASKLVSSTPARVAFDDALTAADLTIQPFSVASDPAPNNALYPTFGSTAITEEGLADEVVAFGQGCFFGTGVTDAALVGTPGSCLARPARLGDIFHSNPVVVRRPGAPIVEESYKSFEQAYSARSRMIYAGTNGGFLEAIHAGDWQAGLTPPRYDGGTGVERFGFMPWQVRENIKNLPIDPPDGRTHYVDGSPGVADVWIYPSAGATTKQSDGREWRTMLVSGLRKGGRHYFALDITNPDGITGPGSVNLAYPGFQASGPAYGWEFPEEGDPGSHLPLMGETWSRPILTRVRVGVNDNGVPHERWVAIFASGYDHNGDPNPTAVTGRVSTYSSSATEGRAIFIIDVKTGEVLGRKKLDSFALDGQTAMAYAMPSTPAVLDLNADGFADVIYVGNLGGQMFKWAISALGGDPVNGAGSGDDVDQPNWPFKLFFEAPIAAIGGDDYYQNFYFPPTAALVDGKVWMAWGAGERRDLNYEGDTGDENNRLYVAFDPDPLEQLAVPLSTLTESDLVDATSSPGGVTLGGARGYYIKGEDGEKFVTNSLVFGGQVIINSFTPTPDVDPCLGRGLGKAYVFDLLTGEGFFVDASNNPERTFDLGMGLPTDPKVSVSLGTPGGGGGGGGGGPCGTGQGNRVYIEKSDAEIQSLEACDIPSGGQLVFWQEVP
jgi:type IV pilus assembly protein PilY1